VSPENDGVRRCLINEEKLGKTENVFPLASQPRSEMAGAVMAVAPRV